QGPADRHRREGPRGPGQGCLAGLRQGPVRRLVRRCRRLLRQLRLGLLLFLLAAGHPGDPRLAVLRARHRRDPDRQEGQEGRRR
ncbi:hypothetical protein, partial [Streptomyces torulosus]|uniref:hypothetical protein n=1 Tax=Streptomyces torulosus TaxID=68276 RepID=UPI003B833D08